MLKRLMDKMFGNTNFMFGGGESLRVNARFNVYLETALTQMMNASKHLNFIVLDPKGERVSNPKIEKTLASFNPNLGGGGQANAKLLREYTLNGKLLAESLDLLGTKEINFYKDFSLNYDSTNKLISIYYGYKTLSPENTNLKVSFITQNGGNDSVVGVGTEIKTPLEKLEKRLELSELITEWNNKILKNGRRKGYLIKFPGIMTDKARKKIDDDFLNASGQSTNKPFIVDNLPDGADVTTEEVDDLDFEFKTLNDSIRDSIAEFFGVPAALMGNTDTSTYNNILEYRMMLYQNSVIPRMKDIADLLTQVFKEELKGNVISVDLSYLNKLKTVSIPANDLETITYLTINEKREILGYAPIKAGDSIMQKIGMNPLGSETIATPRE